MTAIKRIEIRNFQSHEHTTLEPAPPGGLTVLVGPSDSGKTAILRALRWLLYNEPSGADFRRVGTSTVEVGIELADGTWVVRRRTPSRNEYVVNGAVLLGFGSSVPTEVQAATGVRTLRLGDLELKPNLATQLEGPFLGSGVSGPTRAKALGELAGLGILDAASRELAADLHRAKVELRRLDAEIAATEAEMARYSYLPHLAETLARLRELAARLDNAEERLAALRPLHDRLQVIQAQAAQARAVLARLAGLDDATRRAEAARAGVERLGVLRLAAGTLADVDARMQAARAVVSRWARLPDAETAVHLAAERARTLSTLARAREALSRVGAGIERARAVIASTAPVVAMAERVERAAEAARRLEAMRLLAGRLTTIRSTLPKVQAAVAAGRRAEAAQAAVSRAGEMAARLAALRRLRDVLAAVGDGAEEAMHRLAEAGEALDAAVEAYARTLAEAGVCPVCGQAVTAESVSHVQEVLAA